MSLETGQRLLHYRLIDKIGEGGMGVVWKALDTDLDREVAIKVLPPEFVDDHERLARFEREAKLLASLHHPNIAVVHGLHEERGVRFLAMELAGGEDLARRLARGPLPLDEALAIAIQAAGALEAAHDRGVIHRDLKPANIQLDVDGTVKVLDFGLAKAIAPYSGEPSLSPTLSPTVTSTGTLAGAILGTAAYMSPEQAKGRPADKRADVWALGCVTFEMLTGRRPFAGESVAETLASVMKEEPDWAALPAGTPAEVGRLLRRCLVKDPRRRLRDAGDARIVLAEVAAGEELDAEAGTAQRPAPSRWARALPWAVASLFAVALVATRFGPERPGAVPAAPTLQASLLLPDDHKAFLANIDYELMPSFAVSPAGDRFVYTTGGETRELVLRTLDADRFAPLQGTGSANGPFFSPDGNWIGFFVENSLSKVPAEGGARIEITDGLDVGNGASWGADDTIVFAHGYVGPLWTVPASGGESRPLTRLRDGERSHRYPQILPGSKAVLFTIKPSGIMTFDDAYIAVADLETGEHRVLAERGTYGRYLPSGHLVVARAGGLLAAPFDLETLRTTGGAVPVLDDVFTNPITGAALFDFAGNGTCVYVRGDYGTGPTSLVAIDRTSGKRTRLAEGYFAVSPRLSPDGTRLLLHGSAANDQVLLLDLSRGTVTRVTEPSTNNVTPIWGPHGDRMVFTTDRTGGYEIVWMPTGGGEMETLVASPGRLAAADDWSPDGTTLAYEVGVGSTRDLWMFDSRTGESTPYLDTKADEGEAAFSPDGRWLAYSSNETGRYEIYAAAFPGPGLKLQLTGDGGRLPLWSADGKELLYKSGRALMAATVTWSGGPRLGTPVQVVEFGSSLAIGWDLSQDGRTIYGVDLDEDRWETSRIEVLANWKPGGR